MRRREFISLLGSAVAGWPLAAQAQQANLVRRIGVLMNRAAADLDAQANVAVFLKALQQLGWIDGRNVQFEYRWGAGSADNIRQYAAELVALAPDIILATGTAGMRPLLQATRTVPIVFVQVADPVGAGFVDSLSQPGGNATGFMQFEYNLSGKSLELLKEICPRRDKSGGLLHPDITAGIGQFAVIQSVAPLIGVDVRPVNVRDASEIERAVTTFARNSNGGLIVTACAVVFASRTNHCVGGPAQTACGLLPTRIRTDGGLISYGYDADDRVPPRSRIHRSHPQGREASRPAGVGADQVRPGDQSEDRQSARHRNSPASARPCR